MRATCERCGYVARSEDALDHDCEAILAEGKKGRGAILPDVKVRLVGTDGNAFAVLGKVRRAMERAGHGDRVKEFFAEATSGDYDHLLGTAMKWVDVS